MKYSVIIILGYGIFSHYHRRGQNNKSCSPSFDCVCPTTVFLHAICNSYMGALALHSLYCAVDNFSEDLTLLRNLDFPSFPSPHCPLMKVYYTHLCSVHCALSTVH